MIGIRIFRAMIFDQHLELLEEDGKRRNVRREVKFYPPMVEGLQRA
jgi:hypothetical protein